MSGVWQRIRDRAIELAVLPFASWKLSRAVSRTQSPAFRLSCHHFWTEANHVDDDGGASQFMRMPDGNIVMLSIGITTAKVFVTPEITNTPRFTEMASFDLPDATERFAMQRNHRRSVDEALLNRMRKAIAWPKSVDELRQTLVDLPRVIRASESDDMESRGSPPDP